MIMEQVSFKNNKKTLYLVSTPIGNLEDITYRAINTLNSVSIVFAEDTRTSSILFKHYNINTKMISYHEHEKYDKIDLVLNYLKNGEDVALISDAGTPGISDPGFELVLKVIEQGFNVVSIPGATASITALTSSGLLMQPHLFVGFLPRKTNEIKFELNKYINLKATLIIYESPFRVKNTLKLLHEVYGNRRVVLARELTKLFETITRTTLLESLDLEINTKGEYVILVEGYIEEEIKLSIEELYEKYDNEGYKEKVIFEKIAKDLNISKKDVYQKIKIDNK
ncbi:MAG TPA: 16S rRNA (cytidine(1402)-2'-O)-methyltransferase [Acholeplasma sp.]|nr:16S rRNA (cytidine(1402)-2'-O)-methyltransferase [Acholeplasma sp.]